MTVEVDLIGGADIFETLEGVEDRRVGVAALDTGFDDAGKEGLDVGVEDLAVDLVTGVDDLAVDLVTGVDDLAGTAGFVEVSVAREVGVEGLEGLVVAVGVGRPVGVAVDVGHPVGVAGLDPCPPDDDGLRIPALEEFNPGEEAECFDMKLLLAAGSG